MKEQIEQECAHYGFYQKNYFCDLCRLLEPKTYLKCLQKTKEGIINGRITIDQIKELYNKGDHTDYKK